MSERALANTTATLTMQLATYRICSWLFLLRQDVKLSKIHLRRLHSQNLFSSTPVVEAGGPVVSMTSFGRRLQTVYLSLESIAAGLSRPSRLILWVDDVSVYKDLPVSLRRLESRGLEVHLTSDYGPHKKYYPYLLSTEHFDAPLVTADDDALYSKSWLRGLVKAHAQNPRVVNCYRARVIKMVNGSFSRYQEWEECKSTCPSFCNFATGVSGIIYPSPLLYQLKSAGSHFIERCPKADDVWLHVNALRAGFKTKQIWKAPLNFPSVPGTQGSSLFHSNIGLAENDRQLRETYLSPDLELLCSCHEREGLVSG